MDRALPEFNTILHKKWIHENKKLHRKKIIGTSARVDNNPPKAMQYPLIRAKKEQIIEDRCTEIERANRILLERMTNILAGPATHNINRSNYHYTNSPKRL